MKKLSILIMGISIFLGLLIMFNPIQIVSNLEQTNETFKINRITKSIQHKDDTYYYETDGEMIRILYPNQGVYYYTHVEESGYAEWNELYDSKKYIRGSILIDVIKSKRMVAISLDKIFLLGTTVLVSTLSYYCLFAKVETIARISDIGRKILNGKIIVKNKKSYELYIKSERYVISIVLILIGILCATAIVDWYIPNKVKLLVTYLPLVVIMGKRIIDYLVLLPKIEKESK